MADTIVKIETEIDMQIARRISANGFGRIEEINKGWRLVIFREYAEVLEKLFTL